MKNYKIIIAEDNDILRNELRLMLSSEDNIEVVDTAEDGIKAVQSAAEFKPDLMMMDISMPGMNGIKAIREIRKFDRNVKFIMLTVYNTDEYVTSAIKAGAHGYILKDAMHSEFITAVRQVLDGKYYLVRSGGQG